MTKHKAQRDGSTRAHYPQLSDRRRTSHQSSMPRTAVATRWKLHEIRTELGARTSRTTAVKVIPVGTTQLYTTQSNGYARDLKPPQNTRN